MKGSSRLVALFQDSTKEANNVCVCSARRVALARHFRKLHTHTHTHAVFLLTVCLWCGSIAIFAACLALTQKVEIVVFRCVYLHPPMNQYTDRIVVGRQSGPPRKS